MHVHCTVCVRAQKYAVQIAYVHACLIRIILYFLPLLAYCLPQVCGSDLHILLTSYLRVRIFRPVPLNIISASQLGRTKYNVIHDEESGKLILIILNLVWLFLFYCVVFKKVEFWKQPTFSTSNHWASLMTNFTFLRSSENPFIRLANWSHVTSFLAIDPCFWNWWVSSTLHIIA